MILVCGGLDDPVIKSVCARLAERDYSYRLLDLRIYPAGFQVNWHWQTGRPSGYIAGEGWRLDLGDLSGVYVRYLGWEDRVPPAGLATEFAGAIYAECDAGLAALLECLPCPVVNRLSRVMSNNSKPLQALHIRRCGLRTPLTLVTSEPHEAQRFYEECEGQVIHKPISAVRSIVRPAKIEDLAGLHISTHGPVQYQAFIPGDNLRVHTVSDRLFVTRIRSDAVDYRNAQNEGHSVKLESASLPASVAAACLRIAREFRLLFAGLDLKETPEGEYYCFEVNPSPAFQYYEWGGRYPIGDALAELLCQADSNGVLEDLALTI